MFSHILLFGLLHLEGILTSRPKADITYQYGSMLSAYDGPPLSQSAQEPVYRKVTKRFAEIGGRKVSRRDTTRVWHAGIYKRANDYSYRDLTQICGGTLVTMKAVISAAHCFWTEEKRLLPAELFSVGAGKLYRDWNHEDDSNFKQRSPVKSIHIPPRYHGITTSYQEDIAVVLLKFEFEPGVLTRPACVDFDEAFDREQLVNGSIGTVLGWGLTAEDGLPSDTLDYLELPSVDIEECVATTEPSFLKYITSDKICAGVKTGKAVCRGDSGGGLVFLKEVNNELIPYLRGVASTAPRNDHLCNANAIAAFTHIMAHRTFLRTHIPGLEQECRKHFKMSSVWNRVGTVNTDGGNVDEPGLTESVRELLKLVDDCYCHCNKTKT